jgi:restriction endonuclease Mrr
MYTEEVAIDAQVADILEFLEREFQAVRSHHYSSKTPHELDYTVNFHSVRIEKKISLYTKVFSTKAGQLYPRCYEDAPDDPGNEVMSFEVARLTDQRSIIKYAYQSDNSQNELMLWTQLVRLGIAFKGEFTEEAQIRLNELLRIEPEWGWYDLPEVIPGMPLRAFGLIPKSLSKDKHPESKPNNQGTSNYEGKMIIESDKILREEILVLLYFAFSQGKNLVGISEFCTHLNKTEEEVYEILSGLRADKFISTVTNDSYRISPAGILYVEDNTLAGKSEMTENSRLRETILNELANIHEVSGNSQSVHIETLATKLNTDVYKISNNIDFMKQLGLVKPFLSGDFKITDLGLHNIKITNEKIELVIEFEKLSEMKPQERGIEFQSFFASLAKRENWEIEIGTRTANEEIDVILHKAREFFMVECKWEKRPIEAAVVREFYGKLDSREGIRGIIVSMSGFSEGAKQAVLDHMGKRVILLFGPKDIKDIVTKNVKLEDLITEKHKQLMGAKKVVVA